MTRTTRTRAKRRYWILVTRYECPVCGSGRTYRERQYTPKPADWNNRHAYEVHYDYCD